MGGAGAMTVAKRWREAERSGVEEIRLATRCAPSCSVARANSNPPKQILHTDHELGAAGFRMAI